MQTFGDHLRADEDVDLADAEVSQRFTVSFLPCHGIGVNSTDVCFRKQVRTRGFDFFCADPSLNQRLFSAGRAFFWNRRGVSAEMATQASGSRRMPMEG